MTLARPTSIAVAVWCLAALTFLPYAVIPVGDSSHIPLSCLLAAVMLVRWPPGRRATAVYLVAVLGPLLATYATMLFGIGSPRPAALVTWAAFLLLMPAFWTASARAPVALYNAVKAMVALAAVVALVQKFLFLDRGVIPFLSYYRAPGIASVEASAEIIALYVRRPFGLFPEPSYLAGTLALATVGMLALGSVLGDGRGRRSELAAIALALVAMVLSQSGSAVITVVLIVVLAQPLHGRRVRMMSWGLVLPLAAVAAWRLVSVRNSVNNWSWGDRTASFRLAVEHLTSSESVTLFGVGRGSSHTIYGAHGLYGFGETHLLQDIYSVLGRIVLENGLVVGTAVVGLLALQLWRGMRRREGRLAACCALVVWFAVAGLTISYDSAVWIWAVVGLLGAMPARSPHDQCDPPTPVTSAVAVGAR